MATLADLATRIAQDIKAVRQLVIDMATNFTSSALGIGVSPTSTHLSQFFTTDGDSRVAMRVEQRNTTAPVDAVKIVNNSPAYALKIDHTASDQDAVNISHMGGGAYTTLGLGGSNTALSTVKVTNDAAQVGGSVIFAQGTHADRTAAIFGGDSYGVSGSIFSARAANGSNATAFRAIYDAGHAHNARIFWIDANHNDGQLFYLNNATPQTAGQMMRIIAAAGSTAPIIVINNPGTGNHIEADNFRVSQSGNISAGALLNFATFNNGRVQLPNAGPLIDRNVADASAALRVNQSHASSTGDITQFLAAGAIKARVSRAGAISTLANTAPADAAISAGEAAIWFDSTNGSAKLMVKAKQADGTVKTGSIPLA